MSRRWPAVAERGLAAAGGAVQRCKTSREQKQGWRLTAGNEAEPPGAVVGEVSQEGGAEAGAGAVGSDRGQALQVGAALEVAREPAAAAAARATLQPPRKTKQKRIALPHLEQRGEGGKDRGAAGRLPALDLPARADVVAPHLGAGRERSSGGGWPFKLCRRRSWSRRRRSSGSLVPQRCRQRHSEASSQGAGGRTQKKARPRGKKTGMMKGTTTQSCRHLAEATGVSWAAAGRGRARSNRHPQPPPTAPNRQPPSTQPNCPAHQHKRADDHEQRGHAVEEHLQGVGGLWEREGRRRRRWLFVALQLPAPAPDCKPAAPAACTAQRTAPCTAPQGTTAARPPAGAARPPGPGPWRSG